MFGSKKGTLRDRLLKNRAKKLQGIKGYIRKRIELAANAGMDSVYFYTGEVSADLIQEVADTEGLVVDNTGTVGLFKITGW